MWPPARRRGEPRQGEEQPLPAQPVSEHGVGLATHFRRFDGCRRGMDLPARRAGVGRPLPPSPDAGRGGQGRRTGNGPRARALRGQRGVCTLLLASPPGRGRAAALGTLRLVSISCEPGSDLLTGAARRGAHEVSGRYPSAWHVVRRTNRYCADTIIEATRSVPASCNAPTDRGHDCVTLGDGRLLWCHVPWACRRQRLNRARRQRLRRLRRLRRIPGGASSPPAASSSGSSSSWSAGPEESRTVISPPEPTVAPGDGSTAATRPWVTDEATSSSTVPVSPTRESSVSAVAGSAPTMSGTCTATPGTSRAFGATKSWSGNRCWMRRIASPQSGPAAADPEALPMGSQPTVCR